MLINKHVIALTASCCDKNQVSVQYILVCMWPQIGQSFPQLVCPADLHLDQVQKNCPPQQSSIKGYK